MAKAPRPESWTPDNLLEGLRSGRSVTEQIRDAIEELPEGGRPSLQTLWTDVHAWRRQIDGFDEEYRAAQETCYESRGETVAYQRSIGNRDEDFGPAQQHAFLQEMAMNGGHLEQAAYDCGVAPAYVLHKINPKSPAYDETFADRFYLAESARNVSIYEAMFEEGVGKRNPIILRQLAETRLPHLFNAKKIVEVEGHVRHVHELPAAATRQISETRQALLGPSEQTPEEALDADYEVVGGEG